MSKQEDSESDNEGDDRKIIAFTYETANFDELEIIFEPQQSNNDGSSVKKKKKKKKKKKENLNDSLRFTSFRLPRWFSEDSPFSRLATNLCIFYTDFTDTDGLDLNYQIIQKCNRRISGTAFYYSDILKIRNKNDEFLLDMKFNRNDGYIMYKEPNGKQLTNIVGKLILTLPFILFEMKEKNALLALANLKTQIGDSNRFNDEKLNDYVKFLLEFYDRRNLVNIFSNVKVEKTILYICCCFGFFTIGDFINIKKDCIMSKLSVDCFVNGLKQKDDDLNVIVSDETLQECFKIGICYFIYCCLNHNESFECLIPLLQVLLNHDKLVSIDEVSEEFTNYGYLCSPKSFMNKKILLETQLKKIDNEQEIFAIMKFLLELCPNLDTLFVYVELFNHEKYEKSLKEMISLKKELIQKRILNVIGENGVPLFRIQYENFKKFNNLFSDLKDDFNAYFIHNCLTSNDLIEVVKTFNLKTANQRLLKVFFITAIRLSKNLSLESLLDILSIYKEAGVELKEDKIKNQDKELKKNIIDKIKLTQPPLSPPQVTAIAKAITDNYLYPFGVNYESIFNEKFISKIISAFEAKQIIIEILIKNLNSPVNDFESWKLVFTKILPKTIETYVNAERVNGVSEIFKALNHQIADIKDKEKLQYEMFKNFLLSFYNNYGINSIDEIMNLINHSCLFLNENYEDVYISFIKEKLFDKLKAKNSYEVLYLIEKILFIITKNGSKSKFQGKILASIFSYAANCKETTKSIKELLFSNPSRDHFLFKILDHSNYFTYLNDQAMVSDLKSNIRNVFENILLKRQFLATEVLILKKLKNEDFLVISDYVQSSYSFGHKSPPKLADVKQEIIKTIEMFDKLNFEINALREILDLIKDCLENYDVYDESLSECKKSFENTTIEKIHIPDNCKELLKLANHYQFYKKSYCFEVCFFDQIKKQLEMGKSKILNETMSLPQLFKKKYSERKKNMFSSFFSKQNKEESLNDLSSENETENDDDYDPNLQETKNVHSAKLTENEIAHKYFSAVDNFKKAATMIAENQNLTNKFFNKYFSKCTTNELIENEVYVIVIIVTDMFKEADSKQNLKETIQLLKVSIKNSNEIRNKQIYYKSILDCFNIFEIKKEGPVSEKLIIYLDLIKRLEFKISDLNDIVVEIDENLKDMHKSNHLNTIKEIIEKMGASKKLIEYLFKKDENDIRSLIDSFDEHGDEHIRVQNIIELCNISQFIKKISRKDGEKGFLVSIQALIEIDMESEVSKYRNLSSIIETSNNILENLKLIIETIQNREEASKIKILELGCNAKFEIFFNENNKKFDLKTYFRKKRELNLSDLYDLRDRALLMLNNQKTAQDYIGEENNNDLVAAADNLEESKRISEIFINSIELLNNIVYSMNLNYENGFPMNEFYNRHFLHIKNEKNNEIKEFDENISKIAESWNEALTLAMKECRFLSYFWGRELFKIEEYLRNPGEQNFKKLVQHLCFANSNAQTLTRVKLQKYPEIKDKTPFERIKILANYLFNLFSKVPEEGLIPMIVQNTIADPIISKNDEYVNENQIIYVKIDSPRYLNALLICYRDLIGYYPVLNQLLFCNSSTTLQEIKSFLFRISNSHDKMLLFSVIGCERLNFELQDLFLDYFHKIFKDYHPTCFLRLLVITCDDTCHIINNLNHLLDQNIKLVKFQNYKDVLKCSIAKDLVKNWKQNITIVSSKYAGLGKSTTIENEFKKKDGDGFKLIKYPISECENFLVVGERLNKIMSGFEKENQASLLMHFDIRYSNNDEILNEFLFQITLLNLFKTNDLIFFTPTIKHFYIEIANTYKNSLKNQVYFEQLVSNVHHIDKFLINDLIVDDLNNFPIQEVLENPLNLKNRLNIQLICNYFQQLEGNTVNTARFSVENKSVSMNDKILKVSYVNSIKDNKIQIKALPDLVNLKKINCVYLIQKYFIQKLSKENQDSLSFIQLRNFINLLAYYLLKFSENGFITTESLEFMTSTIQDNNLKLLIKDIRSKMVTTLIELSIMGVTQSIKTVGQNQNYTINNLNKNLEDEAVELLMGQIVNFENCKYLMILFGENTDHIGLIYSDINLITKNILTLFKSQDFVKLNQIGQEKFIDYIRNDEDKSIFANYREQTHGDLFVKLEEVFRLDSKEINYKIDINKFLEPSSNLTNLVEKLNKKLDIIADKLGNYVLSADNFLKIILIHNKLKSNLPVVIMGETGVGKTSLISYMALKLLNKKFLTFNIHAGVTQKVFLEQIENYFLIANVYCNEELWIFFDEFNTSECMHLITEMICYLTLQGKLIPLNIKIFAACNPYKLKSSKVEVGLVMQRQSTMLLHVVLPLPESLIEHIWDYGALNQKDEKNYIASMLKSLKLSKLEMVCDLIFASQNFIRQLEEASSVSLRDVDRFRMFFEWFSVNIQKREKIERKEKKKSDLENRCIILSIFMCYFLRLSTKNYRNDYIQMLSNVFKNHKLKLSVKDIEKVYESEQDEYLKRLNLPKGIARNNALRENIFAAFVCIINKVPMFICGKPGIYIILIIIFLILAL